MEHVRAHPSRFGARGIAFCSAAQSFEEAQASCRELCGAALSSAEQLADWNIEI
ncbi:hypothetical protein F0L17_10165 [Streptomyces sp. TRM43335]|uniref:Uncharacterized protein n=1 Tax=Streptomyces taklimakanensis TaxID=2569853 RepID=A0A6G2BC53_9ACTN|nr:hypothetical protein [Streptomyces taklimakanensis]MTE19482.1 hypothetical protein [Streptomyces taklimakanensis]